MSDSFLLSTSSVSLGNILHLLCAVFSLGDSSSSSLSSAPLSPTENIILLIVRLTRELNENCERSPFGLLSIFR